jgi:hypothetical protein
MPDELQERHDLLEDIVRGYDEISPVLAYKVS